MVGGSPKLVMSSKCSQEGRFQTTDPTFWHSLVLVYLQNTSFIDPFPSRNSSGGVLPPPTAGIPSSPCP